MTTVKKAQHNTIDTAESMLRSKNAGPFQITIDIFFKEHAVYVAFKEEGALTPAAVAKLYQIDVADVLGIYFWDVTSAVKVTLRRSASAGSIFDNDCYGAQQHAPLLNVRVPQPARQVAALT